jgi:gliding motility-associated-like protein
MAMSIILFVSQESEIYWPTSRLFYKPNSSVMDQKTYLFAICIIFFAGSLCAQSYDVFSVAGNNLLKINPLDGTLLEDIRINNLPPGESIRSLTYSTDDDVMYGLITLTTTPSLVRLESNGNLSVIGPLIVPNETVFLAEGLAYNETDNKLYAAVSLNGGTSDNDFFSETLIEVDPATAESVILAQITFADGTPDVDNMTFDGNTLIIHDGLPGDDLNNFYLIDFQNLNMTVQASLGFSTSPYTPVGDMEKLNCSNNLLIVQEFDVLRLDIDQQQISLIGSTHDMSQFGGAQLLALTDVPNNETIPLSITRDTLACEGERLPLSAINIPGPVLWNTGEEAPGISVSSSGTYSGIVLINGCEVPTDTVEILFENCQVCEDLEAGIAESLRLGNDTILCTNDTLALSIDIPGADIVWNNSSALPTLEVSSGGVFWATVTLEDCVFQTDTIAVTFTNCDGCDALEEELRSELRLGEDVVICINDTITLSVDIPGAEIRWNTGEASPQIEVNVPGAYWAEVGIGGCVFQTDTLQLAVEECLECKLFVPNVFSPDGNDVNDVFQVFVDETTCRLVEIEMSIFDRWGSLVYQANQNRWTGTTPNGQTESGVYIYLIRMTLEREGRLIDLQKSGDVLLLREK